MAAVAKVVLHKYLLFKLNFESGLACLSFKDKLPGPIYFYLKIVIYRNQMFEMKRDTKILEILIASYDHSTKARPTLSLLW